MDKLRRALSGDDSPNGDDEEQGFAAQVCIIANCAHSSSVTNDLTLSLLSLDQFRDHIGLVDSHPGVRHLLCIGFCLFNIGIRFDSAAERSHNIRRILHNRERNVDVQVWIMKSAF